MIAIDPDEPFERPPRLAGVTRRQSIQQRVDRRGPGAVNEEIELVMLAGATKPDAQQVIQRRIRGRHQIGSGPLSPALMLRRLGGQTERIGPCLRPFEPCLHFVRTTREDGIQAREPTLAPCPIVLVAEPVRRQQQLQRRVFAVLHHKLLNGGLYFRDVCVHCVPAEFRLRFNTGDRSLSKV